MALSLALFNTCSLLKEEREFIKNVSHSRTSIFSPRHDFPIVSGDTPPPRHSKKSLRRHYPISKKEVKQNNIEKSLEKELAKKESKLIGQEYTRYIEIKPYLENISEKIYYLNLKKSEKEIFLKDRGIRRFKNSSKVNGFASLNSYHKNEQAISVGMSKSDVKYRWGNPISIQIAGNPRLQNELWTFFGETKQYKVYFENGKVEGWELD